MKVVLDLDTLREEGKITQADYDKLSKYATQETSALAFNVLIAFGVTAVCVALIALIPSALTTIVTGIVISALGMSPLRSSPKWQLLSHIFIFIGSLLLSGGILWFFNGTFSSWAAVTILLASFGILIRHGLLIVLSLLALSATIGASAGYEHATYMVMIEQPTLTILLFSLLSYLFYRLSLQLSLNNQRLAILASRTSLFLVNMGFWVGSLWGDVLQNKVIISEWVFVFTWAVALVVTAAWAAHVNRRWVFNMCAVFGAIHFYSQWFERLGTTPMSLLIAGILALVFALAIRHWNISLSRKILY